MLSVQSKKRLVLATRFLKTCTKKRVTSIELGKALGATSVLIRHDISAIGFSGGVSNGYECKDLLTAIFRFLGLDEAVGMLCCIAGLGKLGEALLDTDMFFGTPYKIVAGFDTSVNRTEILHARFPLYPASRLESIVREKKIAFALLTSKNDEALFFAKKLSDAGILGIVNYTEVLLPVSENVHVENVSPRIALDMLSAKMMTTAKS